jgi:hypothetical protein
MKVFLHSVLGGLALYGARVSGISLMLRSYSSAIIPSLSNSIASGEDTIPSGGFTSSSGENTVPARGFTSASGAFTIPAREFDLAALEFTIPSGEFVSASPERGFPSGERESHCECFANNFNNFSLKLLKTAINLANFSHSCKNMLIHLQSRRDVIFITGGHRPSAGKNRLSLSTI